MKDRIDLLLERACERALPKIQAAINENISKKKAKEKYLKRIQNSKK